MTVIVRYGCDGCSRLFKSEDELVTVEERFYVGSDDSYGLRSSRRLYCKPCLNEREGAEDWHSLVPDLGVMEFRKTR